MRLLGDCRAAARVHAEGLRALEQVLPRSNATYEHFYCLLAVELLLPLGEVSATSAPYSAASTTIYLQTLVEDERRLLRDYRRLLIDLYGEQGAWRLLAMRYGKNNNYLFFMI